MNLIESLQSIQREIQSRYFLLIKPGLIVTVLLLSAAFAIPATPRLTIYFFLIIVAIITGVIYLWKPPLGIIMLIPASLVIPSPFGGSFGGLINTTILLVIFLTGLWGIDMFVRQRKLSLISSSVIKPAFALIIVAIISFVNGQLLYKTLAHTAPIQNQIGELSLYILSIAVFLLVANRIQELVWLKRLAWLFIVLASIYIIFGRLLPPIISLRVHSLFQYGSDASIFWIWLVALTSSQAIYNQKLDKRWRILLFFTLLATFYVSLSQAYDWKSGWLPPVIGFLTVIWLGSPRLRLPAIFLAIMLVIFNFTGFGEVITGGEDYSLLTRFPAWEIVLEIFQLNPLLGVGIANYYWYTPIYQILGYSGLNFSSHNNYIDILAQMGVIGLLVFVWFFWRLIRLGSDLKNKVSKGFTYAYVVGTLGGIVGTLASGMIGDWIIPFVYNVGLHGFRSSVFAWLFMGGLVVIEQIYNQDNKSNK